ncbi:MAG: hypothetical protein WAW37_12240 [Syntrophobacteraceae bacterium]
MKSMKYLFFCLSFIVCCYSQCVWSQPIRYDAQAEAEASFRTTEALIIPGDYLKAAMKAGEDFQKYINKKLKGNPSPVAPHLMDISNYSVTVRKEDKEKHYIVDFAPLPFQNGPIKGGGTTYHIDSKSFKILGKEHSM